jgi:acetate kinase
MGTTHPVLVINAGSSSLKYQVVDAVTGETAATGIVERIGGQGHLRHTSAGRTHESDVSVADHAGALDAARAALRQHGPDLDQVDLFAVGHRVVHGGARFSAPVLIDDQVLRAVRDLRALAPLHNPANLEGIETALTAFPGVPQVAVFDTAFHQSMPPMAYTYAVPRDWRETHRVRRYGFHGTSFAYVSRRACQVLGRDAAETKLVVLHLGNGASACAVEGGRSVDTSMGLSPLEGLVMGTRSGSVDPGLLVWLLREQKLDLAELDSALEKESGLSALAGTADMRELLASGAAGRAALDVYLHRLRGLIASMAASMEGLDGLVFTGGVGEHAAPVRALAAGGLGFLGIAVDPAANEGSGDREITGLGATVRTVVVAAREDLEIARQVRSLLA